MRKALAISAVLAFIAVSCHNTNEIVEPQEARISLTVTGLSPLGPGEGHYQVWATFLQFDKSNGGDSPQHSGGFLSLGEFNTRAGDPILYDLDGNLARFRIPAGKNAQLLDDMVITIDPGTDSPNDSVAGSIIMGGKVHGNADVGIADLDVAYTDAFKTDFSGVTGKYTIIAPTSSADSNSGVWFIEQQGSTVNRGLRNLPVLPRGWRYEGWIDRAVQIDPGPPVVEYSTGKFLRADSADFDGAEPGRGPGNGFNYPGQDFINPIPSGNPARPDLRYFA
ncbi:MAG: hypothetical protein AAB393_04140, partial [Bacteroidota bacterium]